MNPYNHNPFKTDAGNINNEHDANRALAAEARKAQGTNQFTKPTVEDWELFDPHCELNNWMED